MHLLYRCFRIYNIFSLNFIFPKKFYKRKAYPLTHIFFRCKLVLVKAKKGDRHEKIRKKYDVLLLL